MARSYATAILIGCRSLVSNPIRIESEVDVIVRDLTDTCLVSTRIAGEAAPVLTLVDYGGKANLRLAFNSLLMPPSAGAAFVIGFAARMRDPLRQLL